MRRYKLNYNRKKLSEQELTKHMDFDKFIRNAPSGGFLKAVKGAKAWMMSGIAALSIVAGYFIYSSEPGSTQEKFIDPPLKDADIEYASYSVDMSNDTAIVHETGSVIVIPANAFADADGKPVNGKVELRYREFHDPLEIILSGIPMHYDSAGIQYQFESAGMFEILAYQDGKPLSVNPAAMPVVNMVSLSGDNDFNLYYLDTIEKRWAFVSSSTKENNVILYDSSLANSYAQEKTRQEEISFQKEDPNRQSFSIDYSKEEFPELAAFEGVKFQVAAGDRSYDPKLAMKIWEDVYVKRIDKKRYTVTFSRGSESHTFNVVPVIGEGDFERKMAEYTIDRNGRNAKEKQKEEILMKNYERYIGRANQDKVNDRLNYFVKNNYGALAMRTFNLRALGVWNWDYPRVFLSQPRYVEVAVCDQDGKPLNTDRVYLLIKGKNISYTFIPFNGYVPNFGYGTKDPNYLVAITREGYPAYVEPGEFSKAVSSGGLPKFRMKVLPQTVTNVDELKKLLNFQ